MTTFARYDERGQILFKADVPYSMIGLQQGLIYVGDIDAEKEYVANGVRTPRPANPARLNGLGLVNLPSPCTIYINRQPYECTETVAALTFTYPGQYRVVVSAFPYLDAEFTINY